MRRGVTHEIANVVMSVIGIALGRTAALRIGFDCRSSAARCVSCLHRVRTARFVWPRSGVRICELLTSAWRVRVAANGLDGAGRKPEQACACNQRLAVALHDPRCEIAPCGL